MHNLAIKSAEPVSIIFKVIKICYTEEIKITDSQNFTARGDSKHKVSDGNILLGIKHEFI